MSPPDHKTRIWLGGTPPKKVTIWYYNGSSNSPASQNLAPPGWAAAGPPAIGSPSPGPWSSCCSWWHPSARGNTRCPAALQPATSRGCSCWWLRCSGPRSLPGRGDGHELQHSPPTATWNRPCWKRSQLGRNPLMFSRKIILDGSILRWDLVVAGRVSLRANT